MIAEWNVFVDSALKLNMQPDEPPVSSIINNNIHSMVGKTTFSIVDKLTKYPKQNSLGGFFFIKKKKTKIKQKKCVWLK